MAFSSKKVIKNVIKVKYITTLSSFVIKKQIYERCSYSSQTYLFYNSLPIFNGLKQDVETKKHKRVNQVSMRKTAPWRSMEISID